MVDLEEQLRSELSQVAGEAIYSAAVPPELARRVARRRAIRVSALSAVTTVAVVAASLTVVSYVNDSGSLVTDTPPLSTTAQVTTLPSAPLAARVGAASVWTGREFFVWGGTRGDQSASATFDNGATFDPASDTWRLLPAAPISGRAGAVAVWTGAEVLLWGGSDDTPGPDAPLDGALFDPSTRSWRRIADAPSGRSFARAFAVGGRVVIVGGRSPLGAPATALVYEPAADRWTELPFLANVVDAAATSTDVVALAFDPQSRALSVAALNPGLGTSRNLPVPPLTGTVQRVGIASAGDRLLAVVTTSEQTRVAALEAGNVWRAATSPSRDAFHPPVHVGFDPDTTPLIWTGTRLLSASELGVEVLDVTTGRVERIQRGKDRASCGAGAADAWTGSVLLSWSGQSCRPQGSLEVATGVAIHP